MSGAGLRIAFFGSSLVSAYWNGAATYYRGILRALADRGHRITFYEPDAYDRQAHRDMADPAWATVVVYPISDEIGIRESQRCHRPRGDERDADDGHRSSGEAGQRSDYLAKRDAVA